MSSCISSALNSKKGTCVYIVYAMLEITCFSHGSKTTAICFSASFSVVYCWTVRSVSPYTCLRAAQSRLTISLVEPARLGLNVSVHVIEVPGAIRLENTSHIHQKSCRTDLYSYIWQIIVHKATKDYPKINDFTCIPWESNLYLGVEEE